MKRDPSDALSASTTSILSFIFSSPVTPPDLTLPLESLFRSGSRPILRFKILDENVLSDLNRRSGNVPFSPSHGPLPRTTAASLTSRGLIVQVCVWVGDGGP